MAVGGSTSSEQYTREIRRYIPHTDSWQVISQMNVARSSCVTALLSDNKLMVVEGTGDNHEQIELASIY